MINKLKDKITPDKKILMLFTILGIFNIMLFINLLAYMVIVEQVNISVLHNISTIISAFIILGFISTRLPRLKQMTDGTVYEIGYLVIMGLLSLTISYFNKSTHGDSVLSPFIEMFRMLSVVLIFTYIATKSKSFKALVKGDMSRKTIFWQIVICTVLAVLASYFTMDVNGVPANARGLVVMIASLLGGPYIGLPVGIISGVFRMFMGGPTAFACGVSTIMASVVGSLIFIWNGGKFLRAYKSAILMFLFTGFDMFLITILTPRPQGVIIANNLYVIVEQFFGTDISNLSFLGTWYGVIVYSLYVYFDFSGYSDIAIGLGRMFGFHFNENFKYPFICKTISEFWQRWHISLSSFFRDYLFYAPIFGRPRKYFNLFLVWFCTGMWLMEFHFLGTVFRYIHLHRNSYRKETYEKME